MSDVAIGRAASGERGNFRLGAVIALLAVGILGFVALTVGSAFRTEKGMTGFIKANALSDSAVGYSGVIRLARETGHTVRIVRDKTNFYGDDLFVATPAFGEDVRGRQPGDPPSPIAELLGDRTDRPTLIVLPKWETSEKPDHPGWVVRWALYDRSVPEGILPSAKLKVTRYKSGARPLESASWMDNDLGLKAPQPVQTITGDNLTPLLTDQEGHIVLAQIGDKPLYVLADPDILANMGMREESQAGATLKLLGLLNHDGHTGYDFDVTLLGIGKSKSLLRLAFEPPFLAMTLALAAALLLVGWQAFARFGPTVHRGRAIAFGKAALVDNAAALIRKAGRQVSLGSRYVEAIRERAVIAFGVPSRLRGEAIDRYLDKISGRAKFTDLARAVDQANDQASLVDAARRLHEWQKEKGT